MTDVIAKSGPMLTAEELHSLLFLRVDVFVVEQRLAYADIDGLDLLPSTYHFWVADDSKAVSTVRVVVDGPDMRIGRVCTDGRYRRRGLALLLMKAAVSAFSEHSLILDGQTHIAELYRKCGFVASGADFLDDGILHTPMRRSAST